MKKIDINILKLINILQDDADRIIGGMIRLENKFELDNKYIQECLKLARNNEEKQYVWYNIGMKLGALAESGLVIPSSLYNKMQKKIEENKKHDPSVQ